MYPIVSGSFLSESFLKNYEGIQPRNKGVLFEVVYIRSYCRWIEEQKRREVWLETVQRVVEHSLSLYPKDSMSSQESLIKEAELMFDKVFNLEVLPAGRSLWVAGTQAAEKYGSSLFNCAFRSIDSLEAFCEMFQLLLCGCGVGFGVRKWEIEKLPKLNHKFTLINDYIFPEEERCRTLDDDTKWTTFPVEDRKIFIIKIGDSKKGWVGALKDFLQILQTTDYSIEIGIDYSSIRKEGERIKGFGGRAPGPNGLKEMFYNISEVIKKSSGSLKAIDCIDIANFIGKNVIVGGTRRSSQIALGDLDDTQFIEAKKDLWVTKENLQRAMSNNSISFNKKPTKKQLEEVFKNIKENGEPGFYNLQSAQKKAPNRKGLNPCSEISLDSEQFCNLTTVVLTSHIENGRLNLQKLRESIKLATRIGLRHTNITVELSKWDYKQKRDRLLGVSMTGIGDFLTSMDWKYDSIEAINLWKRLRKDVHKEGKKYAFEMRIPTPLLSTCIKPEGSLSQLPTVSSGIHSSYAPFFIRRIRVSSIDPVAKALQFLKIPYQIDPGKVERLVFEFPLKGNTKFGANEEPAVEQFYKYLTFMKNYVDHNASITVTVGDREWNKIIKLAYEYWDEIVGFTCLPKNISSYPLMPYEEISEEKYHELMINFPNLSQLSNIVNQFENEEFDENLLIDDSCSSGSCPTR